MAECKPKVRREGSDDGPFSDPAFQKLSLLNGKVNKMTKEEIRDTLEKLKMDTRGVKEVLKKRLKNHYKKRLTQNVKIQPANNSVPNFDYYLIIDFEATCTEQNSHDYQHEIIEFPVVLVDSHQKCVVDVFHSYVRPVLHPELSEFCTTLTGITQDKVSSAPVFAEVLGQVEDWMKSHRFEEEGHSYAIVTDGPWDMARFMHIQCHLSQLQFPKWALKWVNLRKSFCNLYNLKRKKKLTDMLEYLGLSFKGTLHSGIDDAKNIATIVIRMLEDGSKMRVNERLTLSRRGKENTLYVEVRQVTCAESQGLSRRNAPRHNQDEHYDETDSVANGVSDIKLNAESSDADCVEHIGDEQEEEEGEWTECSSRRRGDENVISDDGENVDDLLYYAQIQNHSAVKFVYSFNNGQNG